MDIIVIDGHTYKAWSVYQSDRFQVSRLEIHRWALRQPTAPTLVRGYQVIHIATAEVSHWNHGEADQLVYALSYFASHSADAEVIDLYLAHGLAGGAFLGVDVIACLTAETEHSTLTTPTAENSLQ